MKRWKYIIIMLACFIGNKMLAAVPDDSPFVVWIGVWGLVLYINLISSYYRAVDADKIEVWSWYWKSMAVTIPCTIVALVALGIGAAGYSVPNLTAIITLTWIPATVAGLIAFCCMLILMIAKSVDPIDRRVAGQIMESTGESHV